MGTAMLYAKLALRQRRHRAGRAMPSTELTHPEVRVDRAHLAEYARVCGFRLTDTLPPTYPHILAFPMSLKLFADPGFPFPAVGLVHFENRIDVLRPIDASEPLTLRAHLEDAGEHSRGVKFAVAVDVEVDGKPVWSSRSTYLYRDAKQREPSSSSEGPRAVDAEAGAVTTAEWRIPKDIGRRYAAVSGDPNPIHLHPLPARLAGFRRPIAHGMWSKARCLAAYEGRLPDRYAVDVSFVKPILLPSTVGFAATETGFALVDERRDRTYLRGSLTT